MSMCFQKEAVNRCASQVCVEDTPEECNPSVTRFPLDRQEGVLDEETDGTKSTEGPCTGTKSQQSYQYRTSKYVRRRRFTGWPHSADGLAGSDRRVLGKGRGDKASS